MFRKIVLFEYEINIIKTLSKRIINSFFGIRKKNDLENDLKNVNLFKLIILFIALNIFFISFVLTITRIFL